MKYSLNRIIPIALMFALAITVFSAGCVMPGTEIISQKDLTQNATDEVADRIDSIATDTKIAVENILKYSKNGVLDKNVTLQELANLYQRNDLACQVVAVDKNGKIIATYPENKLIEANNIISKESEYLSMSALPNGIVISPLFESEIGYSRIGSVMAIKKDGEYLGYIDVNFDPYDLFGGVQKNLEQYGLNLVVIQKDGTQIYDKDVWEQGTNLLTDERFKDILPTVERVLTEKSGNDKYTFYENLGTKKVEKTIYWKTISTYRSDILVMQDWKIATTAEPGMPKYTKPTTTTKTPHEINKNSTRNQVVKFASDEILSRLEQKTADMNVAANKMANNSQNGVFNEHAAKQILANLYQDAELVCQIVAVDNNGKIIATYPENKIVSESKSVPDELKNIVQLGTRKDVVVTPLSKSPIGSNVIGTIVSIKKNGDVIGHIYMTYDPYDIFGDVQEMILNHNLDLTVGQNDGIQIYETEVRLIGKNALTDDEFKNIRPIIEDVVSRNNGEATYEFRSVNSDTMVKMAASWTTLNYGGQKWKVAVLETGEFIY